MEAKEWREETGSSVTSALTLALRAERRLSWDSFAFFYLMTLSRQVRERCRRGFWHGMYKSVCFDKVHQCPEEWRLGKRVLMHNFTVVEDVQGISTTTQCNVQSLEVVHETQTPSTKTDQLDKQTSSLRNGHCNWFVKNSGKAAGEILSLLSPSEQCLSPRDQHIDMRYEVTCLLMGFRVGPMDGIATILRMAWCIINEYNFNDCSIAVVITPPFLTRCSLDRWWHNTCFGLLGNAPSTPITYWV